MVDAIAELTPRDSLGPIWRDRLRDLSKNDLRGEARRLTNIFNKLPDTASPVTERTESTEGLRELVGAEVSAGHGGIGEDVLTSKAIVIPSRAHIMERDPEADKDGPEPEF